MPFALLLLTGFFYANTVAQALPVYKSVEQEESIIVRPVPAPAEATVTLLPKEENVKEQILRKKEEPHVTLIAEETAPEKEIDTAHAASAENPLLPVVAQSEANRAQAKLLNDVLLAFPKHCRQNLEQLVIRDDPRAPRGQSTSRAILLRGNLAQEEMIAVLTHECGHILDLGTYRGTSAAGESAFPDAHVPTYNDDVSVLFYQISWENAEEQVLHAKPEDFVSGYAMTDPWEDLAESVTYFLLHPTLFRARAEQNEALAQKLKWIETYVTETPLVGNAEEWNGVIEWDVTKMEHVLIF